MSERNTNTGSDKSEDTIHQHFINLLNFYSDAYENVSFPESISKAWYLTEALWPLSPFLFGWASINTINHDIPFPIPDFSTHPTRTQILSNPFALSQSKTKIENNMNSTNNDNVKITLLKQGTFPSWDMDFLNVLKSNCLSSLITAASRKPSEPDATASEIADYEQQEGRVMTYILGSINEVNRARITRDDTPYTAYSKLTKQHGENEGIMTAGIILEIIHLRMVSNKNVATYLTKFHILLNHLAVYTSDDPDLKLSPKILGIYLLNSLSSEYSTFKTQALKDIKKLDVSSLLVELDVIASLENTTSTAPKATSALATSVTGNSSNTTNGESNQKIGPGPHDLCNHPDHADKGFHSNKHCCLQLRTASSANSATTMVKMDANPSNLTDTQKLARYEAIMKMHESQKVTAATANTNVFDFSEFINAVPEEGFARSAFSVLTHSSFKRSNSEIIGDTACTQHMSSDKASFTSLKAINPVQINGIGPTPLYATHKGSITIPGYHKRDHSPAHVLIADVLYCANISVNLLSIPQLYGVGATFSGNKDSITISGLPGEMYITCVSNEASDLWISKVI